MNILEFLFGFPVIGCNVTNNTLRLMVFDGCRWSFVDYRASTGEQTLSFDCVAPGGYNLLTISGPGGNTVDITPYIFTTFDCINNILYFNEGTNCESSVNISLLVTDPVLIGIITNPANRNNGTYIGPATPTACIGNFYYDINTGTRYQFDGTNRYEFDTVPLNLMVDVTYAQLMALIGTATLIPGMYYRITDYQTIHAIKYTTDVNTGPVEEIIVEAKSTTTLFPMGYSDVFRTHIIYFDPDDCNVTIDDLMCFWRATIGNAPTNDFDVLAVPPVTANTFAISISMAMDGDFTLGFMGGGVLAPVLVHAANEGIDFTVVQTGPTEYTYTINPALYPTLDLTALPAPGVGEGRIVVMGNQLLTTRPGWITRRVDTLNQIDCPYDRRSCKFRRWYVNPAGVLAYNPFNAYSRGEMAYDSAVTGGLYISLQNNNTGNDPSASPLFWMTILANEISSLVSMPIVPNPNDTTYGNISLPLAQMGITYEDFYTFSTRDGIPGGIIMSDWSYVRDYHMSTDESNSFGIASNIVFYAISDSPTVEDCEISGTDLTFGGYCSVGYSNIRGLNSILMNNTRYTKISEVQDTLSDGTMIYVTLDLIRDSYIDDGLDNVKGGDINYTLIGGMYDTKIINGLSSSIFNRNTSDCIFGMLQNCYFIQGVQNCTLDFATTNEVLGLFANNVFGYGFSLNTVSGDITRTHAGSMFISNIITTEIDCCMIGNNFQSNTISTMYECTIGNLFVSNSVFNMEFTDVGNNCLANAIDCTLVSECSIGNEFQNNVFTAATPGLDRVRFGSMCVGNTFGWAISQCELGHYFSYNTFGTNSVMMTCSTGTNFHDNVCDGSISFCTFSEETSYNYFDVSCVFSYNQCGPGFGGPGGLPNQFRATVTENTFGSRFGTTAPNIVLSLFQQNTTGEYCYGNTWTDPATNNNFGSQYIGNMHVLGVYYNTFEHNCNSNVFTGIVNENYFKEVNACTFDYVVEFNNVHAVMNACTVPIVFSTNDVYTPLSSINFAGATLVSATTYTKEIIKRPDGEIRIRRLDNADNTNIDDVLA